MGGGRDTTGQARIRHARTGANASPNPRIRSAEGRHSRHPPARMRSPTPVTSSPSVGVAARLKLYSHRTQIRAPCRSKRSKHITIVLSPCLMPSAGRTIPPLTTNYCPAQRSRFDPSCGGCFSDEGVKRKRPHGDFGALS